MHLGVMKALEEAGIHADVVTGTSAGSFAATLYASGLSYKEIEKLVLNVTVEELSDLTPFSSKGFVQGKKLAQFIQKATNSMQIEQAPTTLGIAVTDLNSHQALLITKGDMGEASQASSSIPGALVPVTSKDKLLVDGGVLALVPVKFAKALGASVVIGVDIYCGKIKKPENNILNVMVNATRTQSCKISEYEMQEADFVIRPAYEPASNANFDSKQESIQVGYMATKKLLTDLKKALRQH